MATEHHPNTETRQRHYKRVKQQSNTTHEHSHRISQQNISKSNPKMYKKNYNMNKWDLFQVCKGDHHSNIN